MSIIAPPEEVRNETAIRLVSSRANARPLTPDEVAALERDWTRDGLHHHMSATHTVHRLLATIANLKS